PRRAAPRAVSLGRLANALLSAGLLLAGAVVAAMALGIVANVVLRYGFASGLLGVFEAAQWGMLAAFFLALPACSRGGHVVVDLFAQHGGERFWLWWWTCSRSTAGNASGAPWTRW
ncbi:MAG: TRAP transporter small permease subunit, partial [Elioraea tepidiphila]